MQRVSTADSSKNSHRDLAKTNEPGLQLWVWVISIHIGLSHRSAKLVNIFQRDQSAHRCEASFHCRNIYHFLNILPWSFFIKIMILPKWSLKSRRRAQDKLASDSVEQRGKDVKALFPCKSIKAVMQWENTVQLPRKNTQTTMNTSAGERSNLRALLYIWKMNKGEMLWFGVSAGSVYTTAVAKIISELWQV